MVEPKLCVCQATAASGPSMGHGGGHPFGGFGGNGGPPANPFETATATPFGPHGGMDPMQGACLTCWLLPQHNEPDRNHQQAVAVQRLTLALLPQVHSASMAVSCCSGITCTLTK